MEQFLNTYEKLAYCYRLIDYRTEYLKLSEEDRSLVCANEKARFLEAINSENLNFQNVVNLKINFLEGKIIINV